ncbi:unnamed protein product [Acanthoscelides obtectus]|uniref:RING-type domain-containing protein n=1 Tax=Acanthoscelides obtectus TaxID=200917 RepID=A0A9P0L7K2_ACAOB|nr:unnamed protein product [Acanthoscelides obtectus]CAK1674511.1 hypothetical protein AOBTE_LOCUS29644 [Acanthoscelides obtectus]
MENCKGTFTFAHFCQGSCTICKVLAMREAPINVVGPKDTSKIVQLQKNMKQARFPKVTRASLSAECFNLSPLVHERVAHGQRTNRRRVVRPPRARLCAVCESTVQPRDMKKAVCGDVFHAFCFTEWKKQHKKCPQCRARI